MASFDRLSGVDTLRIHNATNGMFMDEKTRGEMKVNIVNRVSVLVTEYRKVLEQKNLIMKKALECLTKLDSFKCPLDF